MNAIMKEITGIMEVNCDDCQVAAVIQRAHGQYQKLEYCNRLCTVGKKLQKLSKEQNKTIHAILASTLDRLRVEAAEAAGKDVDGFGLTELTKDLHFYPDLHGSLII